MTIAKPLAAGLPIGAILCTETIAEHIHPGDHGSTFAGGPVVTRVADYVVGRISQPEFLEHVTEVGTYLMERLEEINSPHIVEIRGKGLMVGMQLNVPAAPIIQAGYEHGLLLVNAGTETVRFIPPLIAEKADVDALIEKLVSILESINV